MRGQEAAQRYAKALFSLASEKGHVEAVLNELRAVTGAIEKDKEILNFFTSPAVLSETQRKVLEGLLSKKNFSEEVRGLLFILSEKRRLGLVTSITGIFEKLVDSSKGIARGLVESATTLFAEERLKLENIISRYTGKKCVLEYGENKELLGGLVAKVGSYTFDDSLETQLRLMKEALMNRRAN